MKTKLFIMLLGLILLIAGCRTAPWSDDDLEKMRGEKCIPIGRIDF